MAEGECPAFYHTISPPNLGSRDGRTVPDQLTQHPRLCGARREGIDTMATLYMELLCSDVGMARGNFGNAPLIV